MAEIFAQLIVVLAYDRLYHTERLEGKELFSANREIPHQFQLLCVLEQTRKKEEEDRLCNPVLFAIARLDSGN